MNKQLIATLKANRKAEVRDLKAQRNAEAKYAPSKEARDEVYLRFNRLIGQVNTEFAKEMRRLQGR